MTDDNETKSGLLEQQLSANELEYAAERLPSCFLGALRRVVADSPHALRVCQGAPVDVNPSGVGVRTRCRQLLQNWVRGAGELHLKNHIGATVVQVCHSLAHTAHRWLFRYLGRIGAVCFFDLGNDAPDMTAANTSAQASADIAREQVAMQKELIPYYKDRQAKVDALTQQVTDSQLGIMRQSADQATDYYNYAKETFRPLETGLVAEVMRDSTPEAYAALAAQAAARTGTTFKNATSAAERAARTMGVDPSSGQARGIQRGATMAAAAEGSQAFNSAYQQAKQTAYAKKLDVAGIGRNLPGTSTAAYGAALSAGNSASGAVNNASTTAGATIGTPTQYGAAGITAQGNATTGLIGIANAQNAAEQNSGSSVGALIGAGVGLWANRKRTGP